MKPFRDLSSGFCIKAQRLCQKLLDKAVLRMKHKRFRKILISASIFCFAFANASSLAHAVDPVSAATMANALAQAITAYGASQGVSMTYDVTNTDGIGEGMHELWNQFKSDVNDNNVPTYDSFAVTVWSTLYSKVNNHVAINLSDTSVSYLDAFWNWLLTGPAELTKVDNEYFEWTLNQNNTVDPIIVYSSATYIPYLSSYSDNAATYNSAMPLFDITVFDPMAYRGFSDQSADVFAFFATVNNQTYLYFASALAPNDGGRARLIYEYVGQNRYTGTGNAINLTSYDSTNNLYYAQSTSASPQYVTQYYLPVYSSLADGLSSINNQLNGNIDRISVRPYVGDTAPQDVYIPDNDDVNYAPLPYIGELDIPWSDSLYGDGTGTLTDAQNEAIAGDLSNVIEQYTTLTIAEAQDDAIANEVYIPFLPVTLPSFNFSFSGIWHYVVTWVGSLGAWFTTLFTIWSCLPYAMVVPVYATLVVVIVLGVYRRFLA